MKLKMLGVFAAGLIGASVTGCAPPPTPAAAPGTISCGGGSGTLDVSPAVDQVAKPVTYSLVGPSSTAGCNDGTGTGITSARFDSLAVTFPSLSCFVAVGTDGSGPAVVRWSDGTTSNATATATLQAAYGGTLDIELTSGHFAGTTGSATFVALPEQGSCFGEGISRESITVGNFTLNRA